MAPKVIGTREKRLDFSSLKKSLEPPKPRAQGPYRGAARVNDSKPTHEVAAFVEDESERIALLPYEGEVLVAFEFLRVPGGTAGAVTRLFQGPSVAHCARFVVDDRSARAFWIEQLAVENESLIAWTGQAQPGTFFPVLPSADADTRAPWRNIRPRRLYPGTALLCRIENRSPDPADFYAVIYGDRSE